MFFMLTFIYVANANANKNEEVSNLIGVGNLFAMQSKYSEAEKYYAEAISIPIFHTMTTEQQNQVVSVLSSIIN